MVLLLDVSPLDTTILPWISRLILSIFQGTRHKRSRGKIAPVTDHLPLKSLFAAHNLWDLSGGGGKSLSLKALSTS
jgi:hypothetical protein